jgi:hypothetical protein
VLLIIYLITLGWVFLRALNVHIGPVNPAPKPDTFQIPYAVELTNQSVATDMRIALNFTVPEGTIVAGEPINVTGVAELLTPFAQQFTDVAVGFQNSLQYPIVKDTNGVDEFGTLNMNISAGPNS